MKTFKKIGTSLICALFAMPLMAQQTYEEMEQLTVNEQVTTVITASEPIRFVDISTDMVVGDQPINNTIRLKPKEGAHADGEVLAIVTIVTERYRTQYALLYTHMPMVKCLPLSPLSQKDTELNMPFSIQPDFRKLLLISKSSPKRELRITIHPYQ